MSQPVVHFEVVGKDPTRLRKYFSELFGWEFDVPSPVAREVSEPESYGFLNLVNSEGGTGIPGGVGGGPGYESLAVFYVGVPDVEAALLTRRRARRYTGHGSGDITEWPRRRSFHRPRRHRLWVLPGSHDSQSLDVEHQRGIGSNLSSALFNRVGVSPVIPKSFSAIGEALNTTSEPPEAFKSLLCWTSTDIPAESR